MPSKSPAQHRLMQAAAHTKGGFGGVPQKVGKEFVQADKGKTMKTTKKAVGGSLNPMDYDSDVDYKEALQKSKMPKYTTDFTREDDLASRAVKAKYDRKYAGMTMAQQREALLAKDDERNKRLKLGKYKVMTKSGGGKINSCW